MLGPPKEDTEEASIKTPAAWAQFMRSIKPTATGSARSSKIPADIAAKMGSATNRTDMDGIWACSHQGLGVGEGNQFAHRENSATPCVIW